MRQRTGDAVFWTFTLLFLGLFLIYPVIGVFTAAFSFEGWGTPALFLAVFRSPVVINAFINSTVLALCAMGLSVIIALPLAVFVTRYSFALRPLASALVLIPMVLPPFVGAVGLQHILSRYGTLNLLLGIAPHDWLSTTGFLGVALLQALHLYPIMYLNLTAALGSVDPSLSEAAALCGAGQRRIFRTVTLPLILPGLLSGGIIVFLWSLTDLGTPLIMNYRQVLAVEIFDRVAALNTDPTGHCIVVLVLLLTVAITLVFHRFFGTADTTSGSKGNRSVPLVRPRPLTSVFMHIFLFGVLCAALLPHAGLVCTAVAGDWFMTPLPTDVTLRYFGEALAGDTVVRAVRNSFVYAGASTIIDVVLGVLFAWYILRRRIRGGWILDAVIMMPVALPGLILAFGYVATFSGTILDPLKNPVPLLILGYAIRRLPFCFRAAFAGLQMIGVECEEAARTCGASAVRTILSITAPLIAASIIGGAILSFLFAMLEVSESLVLAVKSEFFPLTRQMYALLGKIPDGDSVAAALGVLCMIFLTAGIVAASVLMGKHLGKVFRM